MHAHQPLRIAYDPQIWSFQTYGGVSRYFYEIARRIADMPNTDVSIIAPFHVSAYLGMSEDQLTRGFRSPWPHIGQLRRRMLAMLVGDAMLYQLAPDVIHETYYYRIRSGPRNARRIVTIHDMIHEKFPSHFPNADRTARHKAAAARRADHVICVSESTRRDVIEILGLTADKTSVIHHGYEMMIAYQQGPEANVPPPNQPFLLYVGSRGGYKNFSCLLRAYARSPQLRQNFKLVCFGGGAFLPSELTELANFDVDAQSAIQVTGNDSMLTEYYRSASAFVYPSLYEGFGFPPLEAMANGCPVICSNAGSIPEIVGDAGEYFDPTSVDSLIDAIVNIVASASRQEFLVEKGRNRLKQFSWDQCATATLDVYRKLA